MTVIAPSSAPAGTSWPYTPPEPTTVEVAVDYYTNAGSSTVYSPSTDGVLRALNGDGTFKWEFVTDPASPIRSAPAVPWPSGAPQIYFANDNGDVYRVQDNGGSVAQQWKRSLGSSVRSSVIVVGDRLYLGTADSKIYCLNVSDGLNCAGWSFSGSVDAPIVGTMSIDDRTDINRGWIGLDNGKMLTFRTGDGVAETSFQTGAAIKGSPFVDAGYGGANNNLYLASTDGKVYARVSANLDNIPSGWPGSGYVDLGSPAHGSPFIWPLGGTKYLFIGDDAGRLHKIDATTGAEAWAFQANGQIRSSPLVVPAGWTGAGVDDYVYFGCDDGFIYGVNANTGQLRDGWPVATGGPVRADPVADIDSGVSGLLIIGSNDGKTYVLNIGQ